MMPITRVWCFLVVAVVCLNMNHDFLDGSYAGPHWLKPIDFLMTQIVCAWVASRVYLSQLAIEKNNDWD